MGGGNRDALKKAIRALREQHRGNSLVEQALKQLDPPRKRGRWKGTAPYLKSGDADDAALMLEAYYLYRTGHFYGDPKGAYEPVRSTHEALVRTVERHWPKCHGGAETTKNVVRRIYTRFRREPLARIVAAPRAST
jgi:hypothetical protein